MMLKIFREIFEPEKVLNTKTVIENFSNPNKFSRFFNPEDSSELEMFLYQELLYLEKFSKSEIYYIS